MLIQYATLYILYIVMAVRQTHVFAVVGSVMELGFPIYVYGECLNFHQLE